jgi:protein involved in polysaccharide export with SLBB domain
MRTSLYLLLLVALVGCAPAVITNATPSAQLDEQARALPPEYLIHMGDELEIKFLYNPDFNQRLPVRPDGRISLPLVKEVTVIGMSPAKLGEFLEEKYRPQLRRPEITVMVTAFGGQKIFVDGEVNRAGMVPIGLERAGQLTVMRAIALAGGMKETARYTQVLVIRRNPDGPPFTSVVDLTKFIDGTDKSQDITLMPYDIVFVPKSPITKVDIWVDQYIRKMLPFSLPSPIPTPVSTSGY